MTIRKGDTIQVISGRERGKKGAVLRFDAATNRITVDGVNLRTHHLKRTQARPSGGIAQRPAAMARANVMLVCPTCGKLTRGRMQVEGERKFRACTHCNGSLDLK